MNYLNVYTLDIFLYNKNTILFIIHNENLKTLNLTFQL